MNEEKSPITLMIDRIRPVRNQLRGVKFEIMVTLLALSDKTGEAQVTAEWLANNLHRNSHTIRLAIAKLDKIRHKDKRLIEIIHTTNNGKIGANIYKLFPDGEIQE